ncbi:MAG: Proline dehydrogenase [Ignavibacteria bacterium]|nr:Proline dehydrogenase [Ignavibacteria bacterium]
MLNQLIIKTLPLVPKSIVGIFAKKYIAGPELSDAVRVTKQLEKIGGSTTIDVLGEFVTQKDRALHETSMSCMVLDAVIENKLPTYLSIKPTSLGLGIDEDFGFDNIRSVVAKAADNGIFVRLDMENSPYTTKTLNLYKRLRNNGFNNIGVVIQSYMRRSYEDIQSLFTFKPSVRLCKGIYNEDVSIAYKDKEEIRNNYKKLLDLMFDNGLYVGIATHDEVLIKYALEQISKRNLTNTQYEFQMLLGVRQERRNELLADGHRLRVYVPFGKDWYGYATRRMKENPDIAGHVVRALFGKK